MRSVRSLENMATSSLALVLVDAWFMAAALAIVGYLVSLNRAWRRLQLAHPSLWEELGRPGLFNINPRVVLGTRKYLWSPKCGELNDAELSRQARRARIFAVTGVAMFVAFAAFAILLSLVDT